MFENSHLKQTVLYKTEGNHNNSRRDYRFQADASEIIVKQVFSQFFCQKKLFGAIKLITFTECFR